MRAKREHKSPAAIEVLRQFSRTVKRAVWRKAGRRDGVAKVSVTNCSFKELNCLAIRG